MFERRKQRESEGLSLANVGEGPWRHCRRWAGSFGVMYGERAIGRKDNLNWIGTTDAGIASPGDVLPRRLLKHDISRA